MRLAVSLRVVPALLVVAVSIERAAAAELEIVNGTTKAIERVYLARKNQRKWGPDRLDGQEAIAPGATRVVAGIDPTAYDVRLSDDADCDCELYSVVITTTRRLELTDAVLEECRMGNYLIFYRIGLDHVEVLHVLHGAQDYEAILFPHQI
jgi:ParE toxin of type II toxin-antitoxin system, parDE